MNRIIRRLICVGIVICMIVSGVVGCGSKDTNSGGSNAQSNANTESTVSGGQNGSAVSTGTGNTISNLLAGGRYVSDGDKLFMLDYENAKMLSYINKDGVVTDFGASKEGIVGYLNIWDGYLYYMTYGNQKGVRRSINSSYKGYNIYRKAINSGSQEELVVSGVTDYGTGFYIANGILYYNSDSRDMVTVDLSSSDRTEKSQKNKILLAANEEAVYYADKSTGEGICQYNTKDGKTGEYSIGKIFSKTNFTLPATNDVRYAITIEGANYYYADGMLQSATISKVSPDGKQVLTDLTKNNYDYATGLHVSDGVLYFTLGHYDKKSYINGEIELDGLAYLKGEEICQVNEMDMRAHIQFMDKKIKDLCIYKVNGKYYGTGINGSAVGKFGFAQQNQLMYEPTKKTISKAVVSISHEENIP